MNTRHRPPLRRSHPCRRHTSRGRPPVPGSLFHALGMVLLFAGCLVFWAAAISVAFLDWRYWAPGAVLFVGTFCVGFALLASEGKGRA